MKKIPLSFGWLYALIGIYAVILVALPVCPWIQRTIMNKFHWRTSSFASWSFLQFVPSMYNFANQVWVTDNPTDPQDLISPTKNVPFKIHVWTNHYPFWPVTFIDRGMFLQTPHDQYVYLYTYFQKQKLWTSYHLDKNGYWTRMPQP